MRSSSRSAAGKKSSEKEEEEWKSLLGGTWETGHEDLAKEMCLSLYFSTRLQMKCSTDSTNICWGSSQCQALYREPIWMISFSLHKVFMIIDAFFMAEIMEWERWFLLRYWGRRARIRTGDYSGDVDGPWDVLSKILRFFFLAPGYFSLKWW